MNKIKISPDKRAVHMWIEYRIKTESTHFRAIAKERLMTDRQIAKLKAELVHEKNKNKPKAAMAGKRGGSIARTPRSRRTGLTRKQEQFCTNIWAGMTMSDAYRDAYDVKEGTLPSSINVSASQLCKTPSIVNRLDELDQEREEQQRMQRLTMSQRVVDQLQSEASNHDNPPAVRVRALELLGKTVGAFANVNLTGSVENKTLEELKTELNQIVKGRMKVIND